MYVHERAHMCVDGSGCYGGRVEVGVEVGGLPHTLNPSNDDGQGLGPMFPAGAPRPDPPAAPGVTADPPAHRAGHQVQVRLQGEHAGLPTRVLARWRTAPPAAVRRSHSPLTQSQAEAGGHTQRGALL